MDILGGRDSLLCVLLARVTLLEVGWKKKVEVYNVFLIQEARRWESGICKAFMKGIIIIFSSQDGYQRGLFARGPC